MFCLNCGKELPENAAFCSECGTATNNTVIDNNSEKIVQSHCVDSNEKEYLIQNAKRAVGRGIISLLVGLISTFLPLLFIALIKHIVESISKNIQYLNYESQQTSRELMYELNNFINKYEIYFIIAAVLGFIAIIFDIIVFSRILKTELYFTNKRLVGNTGAFFGNTILNIPLSQILDVTAKKSWLNSGYIIVRTHNGEKFVFFIKYPYSFLYDLEEETAKI